MKSLRTSHHSRLLVSLLLMPVTLLFVTDLIAHAEEVVIENECLQVHLEASTAAITVQDKRTGHVWAPAGQAEMAGILIPRSPRSVKVDGRFEDWSWLKARPIRISYAPEGKAPDAADCSAEFRAAWDDTHVYLAISVRDSRFTPPESSQRFWHGDSVEFWMGTDQFGVGTVNDTPFVICYNRPVAARGAVAAIRRAPAGWNCEISLVREQLVVSAQSRRDTPLAVGINDADGTPKRKNQIYFPASWQHSQPHTFALATFVTSPPASLTVRGKAAPASGLSCTEMNKTAEMTIQAVVTGAFKQAQPLKVRLTLDPKEPELLVTLSARESTPAQTFTFPPALPLATEAGAWVVPEQEGVLYRVRNDRFPPKRFTSMISMPWIGAADLESGLGYMIILETPDDARFGKQLAAVNGEKLCVAVARWLPAKGHLGYERRVRFVFFDRGGYVAMAKRYRAYAIQQGIFRSLKDKARANPNVNKLAGAVDIWYRGSEAPEFGRTLLSLGIDRALIHISSVGTRPPRETVTALKDMGFLVGHYDIYTDLHESGHHWDTSARYRQYKFPDPVIRKSDNSLHAGWYTVYDKGKPYRSYVVCAIEGLRAMRERVPADLAASGHDTWFIDCTTSCGLYECYSLLHPTTRTQDKQAKLEQFKFLHDLGLVCGSEGGRDWALPYASYFEGIMGTALWSHAPNIKGTSGPIELPDVYMEFDHGPARRVPLWELVYHEASYVTWWWGDGQLRELSNWWLKDLWQILYGTMPMWYLLRDNVSIFVANPDAFAQSYARFSPVSRTVFGKEMLSHEFLTSDCQVQRTTWEGGLTVTVNFGKESREIKGNITMPGRSYRLDGSRNRFPNLPLGKAIVMPFDVVMNKPRGLLNTTFKAGTAGWRGSYGIKLTIVTNGKPAARFCGTEKRGWTIGGNSGKLNLKPGTRYHYGAWVRIDKIDPADKAPNLAINISSERGWLTNMHTPRYDTERPGTWQFLEHTFTCPDKAQSGVFNIEKHGKTAVSIDLLLRDAFFDEVK